MPQILSLDGRQTEKTDGRFIELFLRPHGQSEFNAALNWAKISMDALIMNQRVKEYSPDYPGSTITGEEIPSSLSRGGTGDRKLCGGKRNPQVIRAWQCADPDDQNYGRIPNLVTSNRYRTTRRMEPRACNRSRRLRQIFGDTSFARRYIRWSSGRLRV